MPIGIIVNSLGIFIGGLLGGTIGARLNDELKEKLTSIFGLCSFLMGVSNMMAMKHMPAVVFSVVLGYLIGNAIQLTRWINAGAELMEKPISALFPQQNQTLNRELYLFQLTTIIVLFCASGTGIYGSLESGMTGDHSLLISKTILDFFTAMIFAANLGPIVSLISIPQFIIFIALFFAGGNILSVTTPDMIANFKAVGGLLILATGFNILEIKRFPVADMIPAMVVSLPLSYIWIHWISPFL